MTHFGVVCPPYLGHLRPMQALASELLRHGHQVTFLGLPELQDDVSRRGFGFAPIDAADRPMLESLKTHMAAPRGLGLFRIMRDMCEMTDLMCRTAPAIITARGIDALLVDQLEPAGGLVAEHLGLPYVSVANALPIDREPAIPPPFTSWTYDPSPRGLARNRGGNRVADLMMTGLGRTIGGWCAAWNLPMRRRLDQCLSPLAQVSQLVPGFDFPRQLSREMRLCGPFRDEAEADAVDPIEIETPFVFCSLGTLQGGRFGLFRRIAEACRRLGVRLVIAHGGGLTSEQAAALPGRPTTRAWFDQPALLKRAALAVTNGGLNTVLDALAAGVPVVTIPIAFEQGAIGARLEYSGAGRSIALRHASVARLADVIGQSLASSPLKNAAARLAGELGAAGGVVKAADVIEQAIAISAAAAPPMAVRLS